MEAYELLAAYASSIDLRIERYVVHDGGFVADYHGPQLYVDADRARTRTVRRVRTRAADETRTSLWTAARHVTCASHAHTAQIPRSSHAANLSAFETSSCMRLPTAILPARAVMEASDESWFGARNR